jgi:hypothetical protein
VSGVQLEPVHTAAIVPESDPTAMHHLTDTHDTALRNGPMAPVFIVDQAEPFHRSATLPTATQKVVDRHETPVNPPESPVAPVMVDQDDPFQRSTTVVRSVLSSALPTATQNVVEGHDTAARALVLTPGLVVEVVDQQTGALSPHSFPVPVVAPAAGVAIAGTIATVAVPESTATRIGPIRRSPNRPPLPARRRYPPIGPTSAE